MLDDPAIVVEAEDVDSGPVPIPGPLLVAMQDDEIVLGDRPFEVHPFARIIPRHTLEVLDERFLAIGHFRVVLYVDVSGLLLDGLRWLTPVEHQVVEGHDGFLVILESVAHQ